MHLRLTNRARARLVDLHASLNAPQWIAGAYALSFAMGLVTGGRLGDIIGRRRMFLIGVAGFTSASALCGLATTPGQLIGFRLVQGLFAASMIPQGFGILREAFPPSEIPKAFGFFGPVIGLSAVAGPVIGGALTDGNLFGLGWPAWTFLSMAASLAAFAAFVIVERRQESPLVVMRLFHKRAFSAGLVIALVFFAGMSGVMLVFSLYLQLGQGFSAIGTGVAMIPWCLGVALGAALGNAALGPKLGRPTLHIGTAVMLIGILTLIAVASNGASAWVLAGPELLAGAGMGALLTPLFDFVLAGVDDDEVGSASGVLNAMQQLGGAIGIAVIGTIFFSAGHDGGLIDGFDHVLWIEAGVLIAVAALVCLLPMRARPSDHA